MLHSVPVGQGSTSHDSYIDWHDLRLIIILNNSLTYTTSTFLFSCFGLESQIWYVSKMFWFFYRQLFRVDGVKSVLLGPDFITISKVKSVYCPIVKLLQREMLNLHVVGFFFHVVWCKYRMEGHQTRCLCYHYGLFYIWSSSCQWGYQAEWGYRLALSSKTWCGYTEINKETCLWLQRNTYFHVFLAPSDDDDELVAMIKELLDTRIR